jgi:cbb3-type cytochrome oxidase maturation protein
MEVIWMLLPIAILVAAGFLAAYFWAVKSGQFDDTVTPAHRILIEDEPEAPSKTNQERKDGR